MSYINKNRPTEFLFSGYDCVLFKSQHDGDDIKWDGFKHLEATKIQIVKKPKVSKIAPVFSSLCLKVNQT